MVHQIAITLASIPSNGLRIEDSSTFVAVAVGPTDKNRNGDSVEYGDNYEGYGDNFDDNYDDDFYPAKVEETTDMSLNCNAKTNNEREVGRRECQGGFKETLNAQRLDAKGLAETVSTKLLELQSKMMLRAQTLRPNEETIELAF